MKEEFDINQGHGDHNACLYESGGEREFLANWIPRSIAEGEVIGGTKQAIPCDFGERMSKEMPMLYLGDAKHSLRFGILLAVNEVGKENTLVSAYPEYDGAKVDVKITKVHEWAAGVEASLEGEVLGESARQIAFFDTRYALHKGKYEIGKTYAFRLSAFAYNAEVVPEKDREFRFEGEKAVEHRKRCGMEQEYEKDGSPKPVVFRMEGMVAYFQKSEAYPDDAEFQSPVFGEIETIAAFDTEFCKINIAIARDADDVVIPLVARKSLFQVEPKTKDPVRGVLWLQGYCVDSRVARPTCASREIERMKDNGVFSS